MIKLIYLHFWVVSSYDFVANLTVGSLLVRSDRRNYG